MGRRDALGLAATLVVAALAACGTDEDASTTTPLAIGASGTGGSVASSGGNGASGTSGAAGAHAGGALGGASGHASGASGHAGSSAGSAGHAGTSNGGAGGQPEPPSPGKTMWASTVQPLVETACAPCHVGKRFAFASLEKAGATFTDAETDANYAAFRALLSLDSPDQSRILRKALHTTQGGMEHAGGQVVTKGDAAWQTLATWVATEKADRCPDCGLSAKSAYVAYVEQPEIFWALAWDPYRSDHGLRDRSRILLQPVDPKTGAPAGGPIDFLGDSFCGADGRCDFGRIAVSHAGDRLAFECRLSLEQADWVNDVRWNLCIAEIGPDGHAVSPRFLLPPERRHHGETVARSDPFGLRNPDGSALKGPYDLHFQTRRRYDSHPVFSPDDTRVYFASEGKEPRSGASATQTYHGFEHLNHIVSSKIDGTDLRTIYVNDGGVADSPFFLKNGNVAYHTWNLERMDRHMIQQSTADGMNELPVLLGRVQGPNMWGLTTQLADGTILGITGRRRSSVALYVPFAADHTLGTFGDTTAGAPIDPTVTSMRILDEAVYEEVHDFPDGYCTSPPDGTSCAVDRFYADASYSPDGRALVAYNPEKTYVLQGEDMFLAYATGSTPDEQVASMQPYVPHQMGIARIDASGMVETLIAPPAGKALRFPAWVGKTEAPRVQPWVTDETKTSAELHVANVPIWMSFGRTNDSTSKADVMTTLKRATKLRVLAKELGGNFCLNDARPYRYAVNAGAYDHPTHLGMNNATGYARYAVPQAAGADAFGDVPIEGDGSVHVLLPAGKLLLFQGVDDDGHVVVQRDRLLALAPGQRVDASVRADQYASQCMSCHGSIDPAAPFASLTALKTIPFVPLGYGTAASAKPAVDVASAPSSPETFLARLRPLLDQKCVSCHSGAAPAGELTLEATYSQTGNYPAGKWATTPGLSDPNYLAFVPSAARVPAYNYSVSYAWNFKEDETVYSQSSAFGALVASHAPLADLAPWDPAYQSLFANDGNRWVYLGGYFTPNFGRSDRLGGISSDAWLLEILTGKDLDPTRTFAGPDHTQYLSDLEVREIMAVMDVGFPYMSRCDDRTAPSGPNAGMPWGDPDAP